MNFDTTCCHAVQRREALVNSPHLLRSRTGDDRLMTKLSEYVQIAEAARFLGVSQNTLRAWEEAGKIPAR
jgi:hypothetical protein